MASRWTALKALMFVRLTTLGGLAMPQAKEQQHIEISPAGAAAPNRIVRAEQMEPSALLENPVSLELNPDLIGTDNPSTTTIVPAGWGATTTVIYAKGYTPTPPPVAGAPTTTENPADKVTHVATTKNPGESSEPVKQSSDSPDKIVAPVASKSEANSATPMKASSAPVAAAPKPLGAETQSGYEIRGNSGIAGQLGPQGALGAPGWQGLEGDMGDRGPVGPKGPKGASGPAGRNTAANAPPSQWFMYGVGANLAFVFVVFLFSYTEFVSNKNPVSYFFGGECCSEKCGDFGDTFNGLMNGLFCGMCCRAAVLSKKAKNAKAAETWEDDGGQENYGGYDY